MSSPLRPHRARVAFPQSREVETRHRAADFAMNLALQNRSRGEPTPSKRRAETIPLASHAMLDVNQLKRMSFDEALQQLERERQQYQQLRVSVQPAPIPVAPQGVQLAPPIFNSDAQRAYSRGEVRGLNNEAFQLLIGEAQRQDETIERLTRETLDAHKEKENLQRLLTEAIEREAQSKKQYETLKDEVSSLTTDAEHRASQWREQKQILEQRIHQAASQIDRLQSTVDSLSTQLEAADGVRRSLEVRRGELETSLARSQSEVASLKDQHITYEERITKLERSIDQERALTSDLQQQLMRVQADTTATVEDLSRSHQLAVDRIRAECTLEIAQAKSTYDGSHLHEEVEQARSSIATLMRDYEKQRLEMTTLRLTYEMEMKRKAFFFPMSELTALQRDLRLERSKKDTNDVQLREAFNVISQLTDVLQAQEADTRLRST